MAFVGSVLNVYWWQETGTIRGWEKIAFVTPTCHGRRAEILRYVSVDFLNAFVSFVCSLDQA